MQVINYILLLKFDQFIITQSNGDLVTVKEKFFNQL